MYWCGGRRIGNTVYGAVCVELEGAHDSGFFTTYSPITRDKFSRLVLHRALVRL